VHYSQSIEQNQDETFANATVLLSTQTQITDFAAQPTTSIFVATLGTFRYAFNQQQGFYAQANTWHYVGQSIPPAMETQLLDSPDQLDAGQAVVSNSLPLWFALNGYQDPYYDWMSNNGLLLYPSFMVPPNLVPPYGVVHIEDTEALASTPYLDINRNHYQLVADRVQITLYGLQNDAALTFVDLVNKFSLNTNYFGLMNMPVVRTTYRTLPELQTLAMKKTIEYRVSYHQYAANNVARQLITKALPTYIIGTTSASSGGVLGTQGGQPLGTQGGTPIASDNIQIVVGNP
jgi:hypothetical protein